MWQAWPDIVGALGAACVVAMYVKVQLSPDFVKKYAFSAINLFGAALILLSVVADWNMAAFLINIFWVVVSFYGLYRCYHYQRTRHEHG